MESRFITDDSRLCLQRIDRRKEAANVASKACINRRLLAKVASLIGSSSVMIWISFTTRAMVVNGNFTGR